MSLSELELLKELTVELLYFRDEWLDPSPIYSSLGKYQRVS